MVVLSKSQQEVQQEEEEKFQQEMIRMNENSPFVINYKLFST